MRIPLRSLAVAGAAVVTLVATGPAAATPAPSTTTDPAVGAAGWLAQQFVDGTHFDYPPTPGYPLAYWGGLTASGIFGLAATKTGGTRIAAAAAYMAQHVADDADLSGANGGPYDGSVATAALAALVAGKDPTSFGGVNLLKQLKDDECTVTSATCTVGEAANIYSSVSESLTILAEARGGAAYAPSADAVTYFLSLQCKNGGFTQKTSACTSTSDASIDETSYAAMALEALGGHQAELTGALDWLVSQRSAGGYWVSEGGPDVDSTGLAIAALEGAGRDVTASRAWLVSQQVTTGPTVGAGATRGAIKYQGAFNAVSSIKATADALLGLAPHASLATLTAAGAVADSPVLALPAATLSAARVHVGGTATVRLGGFAAREQVAVVAHSTPVSLGTVTADANGTASLRFTVPTALGTGRHEITLTGRTSGLSGSVPVTVLAAVAAPTASQMSQPQNCGTQALACTGRDGRVIRGEAVLGGGLVLAGAGALWLGRRRRRA